MNINTLTSHQLCAYNLGMANIESSFKMRDELLTQAQNTTDIKKKKYLFDQAAIRDTRTHESYERLVSKVNLMKSATKEQVRILFDTTKVSGRTIHNYSWWETWTNNFVN